MEKIIEFKETGAEKGIIPMFIAAEKNSSSIYLGGASLAELEDLSLKKVDLEPYMPIDPEKLIEKDIDVYYLIKQKQK